MKRALPILALLILAILAYGSAYALNRVVAGFLTVPEASVNVASSDGVEQGGVETPDEPVRSIAPGQREYIHGILKRNIFDPDFIAKYNPSVSTNEESGEVERKTDLKVRLLGTVVATPASFSSALIADDDRDAEANGYGVGDKIYDAEVISIEPKRVGLKRSDGSIEFLTMDVDDKAPKRTSSSSTASASDGEDDGIQEVSEGKYIVARETLDKYMNDMDALSRMGRALLHKGPDGSYDGYRMSAIRRNSIADKLGIKNGDIVHSVNGMPLNSMSGAMNALQALQSEAEFGFEITRRGQKQSLAYEVK